MKRRRLVQLELPAKGRGGRRPGAGLPRRKPSRVSHLRRESFKKLPLHVTLKIRGDVGTLRTDKRFLKIQRAFRSGCDRFGMRMAHFSVQDDHVHLVVEAQDKGALARGMQGLAIRLARAINRLSGRTGKVFADRYHARALRSPAEVRNAVHYVLYNRQKHERQRGRVPHPFYIDPYSSASGEACWYVGEDGVACMIILPPTTWLLQNAGRAPP